MTEDERDDLRATAASIVEDAERLQAIETRKLELEPEESETHQLAVEADRLAGEIAHMARLEKRLVDRAGRQETDEGNSRR